MIKIIPLIGLIIFPLICCAQFFCNTSFEERTKDGFTKYWQRFPASSECTISIDSTISFSGRYSVRIDNHQSVRKDTSSYLLCTVNTSRISTIKKIVVTGWVKTNTLNDSDVYILLNDDSKVLFSQCFAEPKRKGNYCQWQQLTITKELSKPQKIWQIYIAACVKNKATAWFDNFEVNLDSKNIGEKPVIKFTENDRRWLNEHSTVNEQRSTDNFFYQISKVVGNKYLLGVGEPTHGTHEAYLFKIRLFKYLAQHYQYKNIALENGMAETYMLDKYVKGEYSPGSSLSKLEYKKYLNRFLYSEEMIDFIEWIRVYNQSHNDKISCIGLDVQTFQQCISNLQSLIKELLDPDLKIQLNAIDTDILNLKENGFDDTTMHRAILKKIEIFNDLCKRRSRYTNLQVNIKGWLFQDIELLKDYLLEDEARWNNCSIRTRFMFNNLLWFLKNQHLEKTLIWAHNGHINKMKGSQNIFQREGSLGYFLKLSFSNDYYCIGIYTATGTYSATVNAKNKFWDSFPLEKPNKYTIEYYMALASSAAFFLDIHKTQPSQLPSIFNRNILQRTTGMIYDPNQFYNIGVVNELFDGIYFIRKSKNTRRPIK